MTNAEKSQLSGVKQTLLYTLYYRALDQRSKAPIVGDTWAAEVLDRITADNRKGLLTAKLGASGRFPPLLRARRLDDWAREFLPSTLTRPCCTWAAGGILRRSLGLAGLTGDDQATGDDSGTAALMISGVIYVDPPGVCIPIGA